jgi:sugar lactone lactonase YvrE
MRKEASIGLAISACLVIGLVTTIAPEAAAEGLKVVSEQTVTGFKFPESVGCDLQGKVFYVSQFGSELKPTLKDGKGKIAKMSLDGKILEDQFLPAGGQVINKPKGIWIHGNRLWVTDIDGVWIFDLTSRKGRKVELPGAKFANDPTVVGDALYVSDNQGDQLFRVEPASFLEMKGEPKVTVVFSGKSVNPNGVYPGKDGSVLAVGFVSPDQPRAIYSVSADGTITPLSKPIGRLDGLYRMDDGSLLVTDWNTGSLFHWSEKDGMHTVASGFKGPADFCVMPEGNGLLVAAPDLVKSEVRLLHLSR